MGPLPARAEGGLDGDLPALARRHPPGGESAKSVASLTQGRQISTLQIESELLYMRKHYGFAGFVLHMTLVVLGDAILAAKDVLKRRPGAWQHLRSTGVTFRLAGSTALGTRPTR